MTELGISSSGSRALLERRHREWLTLWNANCDASRPKKRSLLLQDLELWERTQGANARVVSAAAVKDKDFDTLGWAAKHDSSFKSLIASARKSKAEATSRAEADSKVEKRAGSATGGNSSGSSLSPPDASDAGVPAESRVES
ncbi:DNA repair protein rad18 [Ophiocordyceps camponoti-floridani]|uniref:DNA repair protein rad18 n=1 Tax=Ophiocordyceps camponoti-floridani TaxID=2030778 RepID=A0A8H4Q3L9_9HYPO|nr:DNA repair protein rad18 [Ophiocordyceps camponoti-floridani]